MDIDDFDDTNDIATIFLLQSRATELRISKKRSSFGSITYEELHAKPKTLCNIVASTRGCAHKETCIGDKTVHSRHGRSPDGGARFYAGNQWFFLGEAVANAERAGKQNVGKKANATTSTRKTTEGDRTAMTTISQPTSLGCKQRAKLWKATSRKQQRIRNNDDVTELPKPHLPTPA